MSLSAPAKLSENLNENKSLSESEITEALPFEVLRKTWQPVANAAQLPEGAILEYRLLSTDIFVARLNGKLLAAKNACPHKGAKFGIGKVNGRGRLQCPYHGWEFEASGACAHMPSVEKQIPSTLERGSLQTFAVKERYGMIWVRLDAEELAPLPEVPEFENANWTYVVAEPMVFNAGYRREIENYLDMSHFAFAHGNSLGKAASPLVPELQVDQYEDGFRMIAPFPALESPSEAPGKLQEAHLRTQRCFLPNFTTIRQSFKDGDERVLVHIPSPNDPERCTVFWSLAISPNFRGPAPEKQIAFAVGVLN
ncbi:MAG: aromatic ring-hydroxylating dioxygenase subunit alpha, partial [Spirochaetia bacterium]|nr:aromatic ring-hydroxylating dioxygenase subunit alpha [Spirochaetia bacterium]